MYTITTFTSLFLILLLTPTKTLTAEAPSVLRPPRGYNFRWRRLGDIGRFRDVPGVRSFSYLGGTLKVSSSLQGGVGAGSTSLSDYDGWAYGRGFSILFEKDGFKASLGGGIGAGGNGGAGSGAGGGQYGGGAGAGAGAVDGAGVGIGIGGGFAIDGEEVWGFGFGDAVGFNGGGGGGAGGSVGGCAQAGGGKSGGLTSVTVACGGRKGAKSETLTNVDLYAEIEGGSDAFEGKGTVVGEGGSGSAAAGLASGARAVGFGQGVPEPEGDVNVTEGAGGEVKTEKEAAAAAAVGEGSVGGFSKVYAVSEGGDSVDEGEATPVAESVAEGGRTVAAAAAAGKGAEAGGLGVEGTFDEFSTKTVDKLSRLSNGISEELVTSMGDDVSRAIAGEFGYFAYQLTDDFLRLSLQSAGLLESKGLRSRQMPWIARRMLIGRSRSIPSACIRKEDGRCKKSKFFRERFRYNQKTIFSGKKTKKGYEITTFVSQDSKAVLE